MIRRPPRSTLFPSRRSSDLTWWRSTPSSAPCASPTVGPRRSEEHTSELQSRGHLVCRLLLEKKKRYQDEAGRAHLDDDHGSVHETCPTELRLLCDVQAGRAIRLVDLFFF